jgi:hypothetical protein
VLTVQNNFWRATYLAVVHVLLVRCHDDFVDALLHVGEVVAAHVLLPRIEAAAVHLARKHPQATRELADVDGLMAAQRGRGATG